MTVKKTASKKAKSEAEVSGATPVEDSASPEMEGEEYQQGFLGVSVDDEDHSFAAEAAKLAEK